MNNNNPSVPAPPQATQPATGDSATPHSAVAAPCERWGRIPQELRDCAQWVVAGEDKRPLTATYHAASSTNSATWSDFDTVARAAMARGLYPGMALTQDRDAYTVIDFDVVDEESQRAKGQPIDQTKWTTQEQKEWFWALAQYIGSYTEISRSGKGLHIWVKGKIGRGIKKHSVELYSQERYIVCTGNVVIDAPIEDRQDWLIWMAEKLRGEAQPSVAAIEDQPEQYPDADIYDRASKAFNNELNAGACP